MGIVFDLVYQTVKQIPRGKVATYGQIARKIQNSKLKDKNCSKVNARVVGFALHANRDQKIPCHRVVNKEGRLASGYAFGGSQEQRKRLAAEDASFLDDDHIDLKNSLLLTNQHFLTKI